MTGEDLVKLVIIILIGIIVGIIISLILVTTMYYTRTFFFEYCSSETPYCSRADYESDPSRALQWGSRNDQIFTIDDGQLNYHPPRISRDCVHQRTPVVVIPYPQYCTMDVDGNLQEFKQSDERRDIYTNENGHVVLVRANCNPVSSKEGPMPRSGMVSNRWDM